ncbi:2-amino-4-hydroxy-6-hydroxymethyldihydropteridine diphosphokinase [Thalassotalea hakodatensis]|uniref:2-amino-4-hydroxy-6- hydroxymethyldihydropteridine diphosphokinase n=1 Tax=Thalassotalea hakodatensis TaxID=3030492 RepID=UPI002572D553|nr:2-amino-4-hydroxy-6-hydroxymethyldihydropteridine diphosphokinase [Thalassotalea hakodatensis]
MAICYIGLGSNLSNPQRQIQLAVQCIRAHTGITQIALSALYCSQPMGPQDQPDYMNAVMAINTKLTPIELLDALQAIEQQAGRVRKGERWGARVLDLDILLYDQEIINTPRLTVPHYGMKQREFVLIPLAEIAPKLTLPCNSNVSTLAESIDKNALTIHSQLS